MGILFLMSKSCVKAVPAVIVIGLFVIFCMIDCT